MKNSKSIYLILFIYVVMFFIQFVQPFANVDSNLRITDTHPVKFDIYSFSKDDFWMDSDDTADTVFSFKSYEYDDKNVAFIKLDDKILLKDNFSSETIEIITQIDTNDIILNSIYDYNIHPIKFFGKSYYNDADCKDCKLVNYHILGTIGDNGSIEGFDRLSLFVNSILETTLLAFISLISFLIFGISFALIIGYYNTRYKISSNVLKIIMQSFQCVPILLWILIFITILGYYDNIDNIKNYLYFALFGIFSSPALSNLIISKIKQMQKDDFIVALKLLGLSDIRIITRHMLYFYCKSIIIFQVAYIMAHSLFLDITLNYIEKGNSQSKSFGFYIYQAFFNSYYSSLIDKTITVFTSLLLIYLFYLTANTFKEKV